MPVPCIALLVSPRAQWDGTSSERTMQHRVTERRLIEALQARVARVAIGPSSMRGAGAPGVVEAARTYLRTLSLADFGIEDPTLFRNRLDATTEALLRRLPKAGRRWGRARKGVNIFLRDCLYTSYLRDPFRLCLLYTSPSPRD